MTEILDSGNRTEYETGAVRDIQTGKGRCDLMPLLQIGNILKSSVILAIGHYERYEDKQYLQSAIVFFGTELEIKVEELLIEASIHFEKGAEKYGIDNWKKGIPVSSYIDSAVRHYLKFKGGYHDERHDRAFVWNLLCALWTIDNKPELVDLPRDVI